MNSIKDKLNLYKNTYVNGEVRSKKYEAQVKQKKELNYKLDLADTMFNGLEFQFKQPQKEQVKTLIHTFKNFKELHPKATNEEIILSFIFYIKWLDEKNKIDWNSVENQKTIRTLIPKIEKQVLFPNTFEIIQCRITSHYVTHTPILPTEPEHIDHNILYKG